MVFTFLFLPLLPAQDAQLSPNPCLENQPELSASATCGLGGQVVLQADNLPRSQFHWYATAQSQRLLGRGTVLIDSISESTTYFAEALINYTAADTFQFPKNSASAKKTAQGYFFRVPNEMVLSALWLEAASSENARFTVIDFGSNPPDASSQNDFKLLLSPKKPGTTKLPVNIRLSEGHYIGILAEQPSSTTGLVAKKPVRIAGKKLKLQALSTETGLRQQEPQAFSLSKNQALPPLSFAYFYETHCTTQRSRVLAPTLRPGPRYLAGDTSCGAGTVALKAQALSSPALISWYGSPAPDAPLLHRGEVFRTNVSSSRSFYVSETALINQHWSSAGPQTTVLADTGKTRGFVFRAPSDFYLSGIRVPKDAATGPQNIAVVSFKNQTPPADGGISNNFELLALFQQDSSEILPLNLFIREGSHIGILGNRNDSSSLGLEKQILRINGDTAEARRLGMSHRLSTTPPQDLWTSSEGGIGRVELLVEGRCKGPRQEVKAYVAPPLRAASSPVNPTAQGARNGAIKVVMSNGTAPYDFYWSNGQRSKDLQGLKAGTYDLNIRDANGCRFFLSESLQDFDDTPSLAGQPLRLFPNPTESSSTLEVQGSFIPDDCRVRLLNGSGETIRLYAPADWAGRQLRIDLRGEAIGNYFLRIEQDGELQQMKLLKQ